MFVFQNYTQRTTKVNWANQLDIPLLRHVCVFQKYTYRTTYLNWVNHLATCGFLDVILSETLRIPKEIFMLGGELHGQ